MLEHLPWIPIAGTALLLVIQLFLLLGAFRILLDHDELPAFAAGSAPFISAIVPARNEAEHIGSLLNDLLQQDYPADRFELLVVDDGSVDGTFEIAQRLERAGVRVLRSNGGTGKKAAIELGVEHARGDLILLTDADARCGPMRLKSVAQAWQRAKFDMLLMPITVRSNNSLLQELQANEQAGFMAVVIASAREGYPLIANGANMAFRRSAFEALGGYDDNRQFASGDDMFLLEKMRAANKTVASLAVADAVVIVPAAATWRSFVEQRLRWAGKMKVTAFGMMSLLPTLALVLPVLLWICTFSGRVPAPIILLLWCAWLVPIVALTTAVNDTIGRRPAALSVALHLILFSIHAPIIAALSLFLQPKWKGRIIHATSADQPLVKGLRSGR